MTEPFLGQLLLASFNFPPKGYALCNGALLPINQNQALFSLLGTMYGGNGQTNFALPDLQGRVAVHAGAGLVQGEAGGESAVTLSQQHMPEHLHTTAARNEDGTESSPVNAGLAGTPSQLYHDPTALTSMSPTALTSTGGSQPHPNMQPYTVINCCIAIQGIFPSRN